MNLDAVTWLVEGLWASSAAIVLVLLLRRPWRSWFGAGSAPILWAIVPAAVLAISLPARVVTVTAPQVDPSGSVQIRPAAAVSKSTTPAFTAEQALLALWLSGSLIGAGYFFRQQRRFRARLGQTRPVTGRIYIASRSDVGPAVLGLLRPRIIVPADFSERYSAEQQALILSHEYSHLRRGDIVANAIATALRCLYWFNPLIHYAAVRLRHDHELASDADVLQQHPKARRRYADTLLNVQLAVPGLPVGCLWQSSHPLKERILMISTTLPSPTRRRLGLAIGLTLAAGSAMTAWAAQPQQIVLQPSAQLLAESSAVGTGGTELASTGSSAAQTREAGYRALKAPKYPQSAIDGKQGGKVVLSVHVLSDGKPGRIEVATSSSHPALDEAALTAVAGWSFEPKTLAGQPVESWVKVPVCFSLSESDSACSAEDGALDTIQLRPPQPKPADRAISYRALKPPVYPASAIAAKQGGKVILSVSVAADGSTGAISVQQSSQVAELDAAAVNAVRSWSFNPAIEQGRAIDAKTLVPVCFAMDENSARCEAPAGALDGIYLKPPADV